MDNTVKLINRSSDGMEVVQARWCDSYLCRMFGLMFRGRLEQGKGLLIVEPRTGIGQTTIHMWFVFFPLGVIWLDDSYKVVDKRLAKPWRIYAPKAPARYMLEGRPEILDKVAVGDELAIA
jgi:uncharacterized membrane protein (UPF0127 family)